MPVWPLPMVNFSLFWMRMIIMRKIKPLLAAVMMLAAMPAAIPAMEAAAAAKYDGVYVIRNVASGKYLNVDAKSSSIPGANIQQHSTDTALAGNTWRLEGDADGNYCIYSMLGDGKTMGLAEDGGNIVLGDAAKLQLEANADGSFRIMTGGKAVEVKDASTDDGANVQTWEPNGINCQDWEFIPVNFLTGGTETKCIFMSAPDYLPGDLNGDEAVDVFDLALLKREFI